MDKIQALRAELEKLATQMRLDGLKCACSHVLHCNERPVAVLGGDADPQTWAIAFRAENSLKAWDFAVPLANVMKEKDIVVLFAKHLIP